MNLRIDVWSDVACPWCWVGKRRLEQALSQFEHGDSVDVVWRAFELDASAPRMRDEQPGYVERLARKYRTSVEQAQGMIDRMTAAGAEDGLTFRFDRIRSGNTFDAHRLLHFAKEHGVQNALKERFFTGYFSQGEPIGDPAALARMASEVGLDETRVVQVLETDTYADEVREDQAEARTNGVSGVPFFVVGNNVAFSGAQPADVLSIMLSKVWNELAGKVRRPLVATTKSVTHS